MKHASDNLLDRACERNRNTVADISQTSTNQSPNHHEGKVTLPLFPIHPQAKHEHRNTDDKEIEAQTKTVVKVNLPGNIADLVYSWIHDSRVGSNLAYNLSVGFFQVTIPAHIKRLHIRLVNVVERFLLRTVPLLAPE